jgi:predicted DNA-binding transcriptional regulator YafY
MAIAGPPQEMHNINISAYRVLYILLALVQYRSLNMIELNRCLFENSAIRRIYNTETLTKYINTLREVGCDIPRSSSRTDYNYELRKHPFRLTLDEGEARVADQLLRSLSTSPDERLYQDYQDFLEWFSWFLEFQKPENSKNASKVTVLFPELEARRATRTMYRQYCRDAFTLQIKYLPEQADAAREILLEPHDVLEHGSRLFLLGLDVQTQEQVMLNIERIEYCRQLPSKNKRPAPQTTVIFTLFDRLAKNYRLYPDEKVIYRGAAELQIKARVSRTDDFVNRLMKYGPLCEVISPNTLRENIKNRIAKKLAALSPQPNPGGQINI